MGIFLDKVEIKTFRGISNYSIEDLKSWTSITGPNSTTKSSILYALSFLGSNRMHELSDIPADIRTNKINPFEVPIKITYLFKIIDQFDNLMSDDRITEILIESYENQLNQLKHSKFDQSIRDFLTSSLFELRSRKPFVEILSDALYEAIKGEIQPNSTRDEFKPLFHTKDVPKKPEEIFKECNYLQIDLEMSLSDGPHSRFFILDEAKNIIINDEVFYHWLSKIKAISDDITFIYLIGATFIKSVLSFLKNTSKQISPSSTLSIDGSNIIENIEYILLHHPERLIVINDYFQKIFNHSIKFRKVLPTDCVENEIVIDLDESDNWFSLEKLSDGMLHVLRILLQFVSCKKGDILIIDEPELHLHPGAARVLRNILSDKKSDIQIICATHAPLFLDSTVSDNIILNQKNSSGTLEPNVLDSTNLELALSELGSSGIDILLFDVIIWVEGPSDELYLNRWLNLLSNQLEVISLSDIGFVRYGGADMLKHFDVEKIKLINRKSIFIIDSDKNSSTDSISDIKRDFLSECRRNEIYCWLTKKREIENYIPIRILEEKLSLPSESLCISKYDDVIQKLKDQGRNYKKVELANLTALESTLDDINNDEILKVELDELIKKINSYN
jgi:predicted ATP-dependent endonuclease of OLD family